MNSKPGFLKYLAYMQLIGIAMVVLMHSFHEFPGQDIDTRWVYRLIYNIAMPIFFFVSGFLLYHTNFTSGKCSQPANRFIYSKFKRLIIPLLFLSLITFLPRALLSGIADDPIDSDAAEFLSKLISGDAMIIPYFWFLYSNFLLLIFSFIVLKCTGFSPNAQSIAIYVMWLAFAIIPLLGLNITSVFGIASAVKFGFFFTFGLWYRKNLQSVEKLLRISYPITCIVLFAVWVVGYYFTESRPAETLFLAAGVLAFLSLGQIISNRENAFFDMFIGANYMIFLLSWYVNVSTQQILAHYVTMPWIFYTLLSFFGGLLLPWLLYTHLKAHPNSLAARLSTHLLGQTYPLPAQAPASDSLPAAP